MAWVDGKWVDDNDSVASNLNGLLASDSKYIQQARASGERQAAKRGLMNSSIAAGSSESAAIAAALPIASQDANINAQKNQTQATFDVQTKLNDQTGKQQTDLAVLNNEAEAQRQAKSQESQAAMQKEQISASDRQALLQSETSLKNAQIQSADTRVSAYLQSLGTMTSNSKLKARDRNAYIAEMQRVTGSATNLASNLSGQQLLW